DLAEAYRADLLGRFEALFPAAPAQQQRGLRPFFRGPDPRLTDAGRAAARRLARDIEPLPAALAAQALADPGVLAANFQALETHGFAVPSLTDLASEIIRLRLESEHLDTDALRRHLASKGFSALLTDIDRAAAKSGAPFIQSDVTLAAARSQWSHAF